MSRCKRQSEAAEQLLSGLEGEKVNWIKNIEGLEKDFNSVLGDVLLSSGIISYLGIFPNTYRISSIAQWQQTMGKLSIPFTSDFSFQKVMSEDITIGNWTNKYLLPNDSFSIDNAIIVQNSIRYSLMIDPQGQANRWLKEMEKENQLFVLKPGMKTQELNNTITNALEQGYVVIYENAEEKIDFNIQTLL